MFNTPCMCRKIRCDGKSWKDFGFWSELNKAYERQRYLISHEEFFSGGQNNHMRGSGNNQSWGWEASFTRQRKESRRVVGPLQQATALWSRPGGQRAPARVLFDPSLLPLYGTFPKKQHYSRITDSPKQTVQVHRKIRQCMYCMHLVIYILVRWHVTCTAHRKLGYIGPPSIKIFCHIKIPFGTALLY